ncbi:MAG: DUF4012 domain-containing protein, partial [Patescibacteria group bacterium]
PEIAGLDGVKHYLLFLQNSTELRPTGGFWGTYGILTVKDGDLVSVMTDDIYKVDAPAIGKLHTAPPSAMVRYLGADDWFLRDANWSPDVPTSVSRALEMYRAQTMLDGNVVAPKLSFDGVVLITPEFVKRLMSVLGSVTANGIVFTPENLVDKLEYEVERAYAAKNIPQNDRKDIVQDISHELLGRAKNAKIETAGKLLDAFSESLSENDIMLWSARPELQKLFATRQWTGAVRAPEDHDFFMPVDANLAALKTDAAMKRSYSYSIERSIDGDLVATARIDYDHLGTFDYKTTRYRTYTRVYAPKGSEFIRAEGNLKDDRLKNPTGARGTVDVGEELGAAVFGAFTSIEPGGTGHLSFTYKLPKNIKEQVDSGKYILDVQRQPGVGRVPLSVHLDFNKKISSASPPEASEYWFDDIYTSSGIAVPKQRFEVNF